MRSPSSADDMASNDDVDVEALQQEVRALKQQVQTLILEVAGSHQESIDALARLVMEMNHRLAAVEIALHIRNDTDSECEQPPGA